MKQETWKIFLVEKWRLKHEQADSNKLMFDNFLK